MMKIGFFGAGKMAHGILAAIPNRRGVIMSDVNHNRNREIAKKCDLIFLAVRPGDVEAVAAEVKEELHKGQILVSIVAGKSLAKLRASFGNKVKIIRVMPNLCLRAGEGMCVLSSHHPEVEKILQRAGKTLVLAERYFDAVTALSGSGPAYFAYMEEAMVEGGIKLGLKPAAARLLAEQTMLGTAKFLSESGAKLDEFIAGVATKGGTTAAGMQKLDRGGVFRNLVAETLEAAATRSKELG